MKTRITIATRQSPLALWQAEHIRERLLAAHRHLTVELLTMTTTGDKILDSPLAKIGGKGLFVKELEKSLLDGRADIAVHSMKDVPVELPESLTIAIFCQREDPRDALVSRHVRSLDQLPPGARVGTSSLRRRCQLLARRPDLQVSDLRGNVGTRLARLDDHHHDAIILAAAGLRRLNLGDRIAQAIPVDTMIPAIGQGVIGIECRSDDDQTRTLIEALDDADARDQIRAERALNHRLEGGCQVPIAGHARLNGDELIIEGLVGTPDGQRVLRARRQGPRAEAEKLGVETAEALLRQGADIILRELYQNSQEKGAR